MDSNQDIQQNDSAMFAGDVLLSNMKTISNMDENKLAVLVEKYGAEQLLNEGFNKKKLAGLIGAGIITGSSLMDLPKKCTSKEDNRIEYNNPYGINNREIDRVRAQDN